MSNIKEKRVSGINLKERFAFVIPVYNHAGLVAQVIRQAMDLNYPVFVIDDGSTDDTAKRLAEIQGINIISHKKNMGKGAAIMSGFIAASAVADWAITIDADGQHYPQDAIKLIAAIPEGILPNILGKRDDMNRD